MVELLDMVAKASSPTYHSLLRPTLKKIFQSLKTLSRDSHMKLRPKDVLLLVKFFIKSVTAWGLLCFDFLFEVSFSLEHWHSTVLRQNPKQMTQIKGYVACIYDTHPKKLDITIYQSVQL